MKNKTIKAARDLPKINFEMERSLYESISSAAALEGRSRASYVRRVLAREIAHFKARKEGVA